MKEEHDETTIGESTTDHQLHVLNEIFIHFFGKGIDGKVGPNTTYSVNTHNRCQLCHSEEYTTLACPKFADTRPKCAKCGGGHKIDNCGLKCYFCFVLGHTEERCWKKSIKSLPVTTNFLEVLVDDEEATLVKLNRVYGKDQHIFSKVKIPKRRLPITTNPIEEQKEVIAEDEHKGANMGSEIIVKSNILFPFIKGNISFNSHGNHYYNSKRTRVFGRIG
jgi:hypothetical protein